MSILYFEEHEQGRDLIDISELNPLVSLAESYSCPGTCLKLFKYKNFRFIAYPGPDVVDSGGRSEHRPYHFHVKRPGMLKELRIRTRDFQEIDGIAVPKPLKLIFGIERIRSHLRTQTKSVYNTGRLNPKSRLQLIKK